MKKSRVNRIATAVIILLSAVLLLSFGKQIDQDIPNWEDLFAELGLIERTTFVEGARVDFVDVGQGECAVIRSGDLVALVDAGDTSTSDTVMDFLQEEYVEKIDLLFISHPHADHIGAVKDILKQYNVDKVVTSYLPEDLSAESEILDHIRSAVADSGAAWITAFPKDVFSFGNGNFSVVGPIAEYGEMNNNSLVLRFNYGNISFLFTGDMEVEAEADLVQAGADLRSDVLKVCHHGSHTSSTVDFLEAVAADYAVISCGENNDYGFPHTVPLERLTARVRRIYRTDLSGTVTFYTDGETITAETEGKP